MATNYTNREGSDTRREEYGADRPNMGSARSDYGKHAYGGRLGDSGVEGTTADYGREFSARGQKSGEKGARRRYSYDVGERASAGVPFLTGLCLGGALMYLLDPERGRTRRKLLSDKLTSLTNTASKTAARKSRDLRNRAQGVLAEAGLAGGGNERTSGAGDRSHADQASASGSSEL